MWYCRFLFWLYTFPHPNGQENFSCGCDGCCWFKWEKCGDSPFTLPEYSRTFLLKILLSLVIVFEKRNCGFLWWTEDDIWSASASFHWLETTFSIFFWSGSDIFVFRGMDSSTERKCHGSSSYSSATKGNYLLITHLLTTESVYYANMLIWSHGNRTIFNIVKPSSYGNSEFKHPYHGATWVTS